MDQKVMAPRRQGSAKSGMLFEWVRLSRPRDWCTSKLPFICAMALWLNFQELSVVPILAIMATISAYAAFGYGLNDVADRSSDAMSDKNNHAADLPATNWGSFLVVSAVASIALGFTWAPDLIAPGLVLAGLVLSAAYSVPPVRLKEQGFVGIVAGAAAQWTLPVLVVAAAGSEGRLGVDTWCLTSLALLIGTRWMCVHQLHDLKADRKARVRTYATGGGRAKTVILVAFLLELGLIVLALAITWPNSLAPALAFGLWLLKMLVVPHGNKALREMLMGYEFAPLADYYFFLLPLSLVLISAMSEPALLALVPVLLVLGGDYMARLIREWRTTEM